MCCRLQAENRALLQERAENQQVIQLLEMQKDILSKTVSVASRRAVAVVIAATTGVIVQIAYDIRA